MRWLCGLDVQGADSIALDDVGVFPVEFAYSPECLRGERRRAETCPEEGVEAGMLPNTPSRTFVAREGRDPVGVTER
jgi:hypothetical protein